MHLAKQAVEEGLANPLRSFANLLTAAIGLSLRSSPIGARVRNKWEAKRSLSTRFEQTRFAAAHPRPVSHKEKQHVCDFQELRKGTEGHR